LFSSLSEIVSSFVHHQEIEESKVNLLPPISLIVQYEYRGQKYYRTCFLKNMIKGSIPPKTDPPEEDIEGIPFPWCMAAGFSPNQTDHLINQSSH
jgi:hypothetical protein